MAKADAVMAKPAGAAPGANGAPELEVVGDLWRRALPVAPVLVAVSAIFWGVSGALSCGYAIVLVLANFAAAAGLMAWGARISLGVLMGAVLGGYILRLALVVTALVLVKDASWVSRAPLFATVLITHVGLLVWEAKSVSLSLAYPGLKPARPARPARTKPTTTPTASAKEAASS